MTHPKDASADLVARLRAYSYHRGADAPPFHVHPAICDEAAAALVQAQARQAATCFECGGQLSPWCPACNEVEGARAAAMVKVVEAAKQFYHEDIPSGPGNENFYVARGCLGAALADLDTKPQETR